MADIRTPAPFGAPPKKGKGLFGSKPKLAQHMPDTGMRSDMTVINTRLRVSEERSSDLRRKLQVIESNMLSHHKKVLTEVKVLKSDILAVKRQIRQVEERIVMVIKELQLTARKEDVDIMTKYVEMWNPVRFVGYEQVEKIVDEKLAEHHEEMHEE